jgi:hypothetical protein
MSSSFAKCSRGQYDHPIFPASEDVERRLPGFATDLHIVSRLPQTVLIVFATYVLRREVGSVDNVLDGVDGEETCATRW